MCMRKDKEKIINLRKQGKSYREIQKITGASRSTLCGWFKNEEWSKHTASKNIAKNIKISTERIKNMNIARGIALKNKYEKVLREAESEYKIFKQFPLFVSGLMLYSGEGDRLNKGIVRLANVNFNTHKIFINFAKEFLKTDPSSIKFSVLLYPDSNIDDCVSKWRSELGIIGKNIYKPQVINGKLKRKKLHFGVGTTIILSSFLKKKLLYWIDQLEKDLS